MTTNLPQNGDVSPLATISLCNERSGWRQQSMHMSFIIAKMHTRLTVFLFSVSVAEEVKLGLTN